MYNIFNYYSPTRFFQYPVFFSTVQNDFSAMMEQLVIIWILVVLYEFFRKLLHVDGDIANK